MKHGIVLLSGGIDSTTALYWAKERCDRIQALTFDYSQRHNIEIENTRELTRHLGIPHTIFPIDLSQIGGSSLTDRQIPLPSVSSREELGSEIPSTYVPFRNGIFLALAAAEAERFKSDHIICGFNIIDSPHYPDTRPSFVRSMEKAINKGTRLGNTSNRIKIVAPFLNKKKSDIIRAGLSLGVDYSLTISCYAGSMAPCGDCSACLLRREAWEEVGLEDPLIERTKREGRS